MPKAEPLQIEQVLPRLSISSLMNTKTLNVSITFQTTNVTPLKCRKWTCFTKKVRGTNFQLFLNDSAIILFVGSNTMPR